MKYCHNDLAFQVEFFLGGSGIFLGNRDNDLFSYISS